MNNYSATSGTSYIFYVGLVSQADTKLLKANPTIAAGDFKVSIDGGAFANLTTLPTVTPAAGTAVKITLSAAEMTGTNIFVTAIDAAGAEWCDDCYNIQTTAMPANLQQIDGTANASATFNLKKLNVVNNSGDAIHAESTGGNGSGISGSGHGTGHGIGGVGGATGNGITGFGGATSGAGIVGQAVAGNGSGIQGLGIGSGAGVRCIAGATGNGFQGEGGATSGSGAYFTGTTVGFGMACVGAGNSGGLAVFGAGSGNGFEATGGSTGNGAAILGGSTSGNGATIAAQTNGAGISTVAVGSGQVGIVAQGGTNGAGIYAFGNGSGQGVIFQGGATGNGLNAVGGSTSGAGAYFNAIGSGPGLTTIGVGNVSILATQGISGPLDASVYTSISDALLKRDMSAVTGESSRSLLNCLRFIRNKWSFSGATLTVTKEDDATPAWTATVATDAAALPIVSFDGN
jgi:hypothetical protein